VRSSPRLPAWPSIDSSAHVLSLYSHQGHVHGYTYSDDVYLKSTLCVPRVYLCQACEAACIAHKAVGMDSRRSGQFSRLPCNTLTLSLTLNLTLSRTTTLTLALALTLTLTRSVQPAALQHVDLVR